MLASPPIGPSRIVCLLVVRDGGDRLPSLLDEAAGFCDGIVAAAPAGARSTLDAHPLVDTVFDPHPSGRWDDRLLAAADTLDPDWVLCLEGDESMDPADAAALRMFVETEALTGFVYGLRRFRAFADGTYDPSPDFVFRVFAYRPGQRFRPDTSSPVPDDVPPDRLMETNVRLRRHAAAPPDGGGPPWRPRPPGLRALEREVLEPGPAVPARPRRTPPLVVCLLPARNCEADLPGWFESVSRFADAVVALDDGSTDDTGRLLAAEPLVKVLLTNPRREAHLGWDDSVNRNRLLAAAADLDPDWIVSLDADERIPSDDGAALRAFLQDGAEPGYAYALGVYRMIGDIEHYDELEVFAVRAFAFEPGQRFSGHRFHFAPVPTSIPEVRWVVTSIRVQHLAFLDETRRRARWEKYRQVDPGRRWESDYAYTLRGPGEVKPWLPRSEDQEVVLTGAEFGEVLAGLQLQGPDLSIVVVGDDARDGLDDRGLSLDRTEVLVADGTDGAARDVVLRSARGDYVVFLGPGDRLDGAGIEALLRAHEEGHAMVGGTVTNADRSLVGWASYFLDHAASLPDGAPPTPAMPPIRCSYARTPVLVLDRTPGTDPPVVMNQVLARWSFSAARVDGLSFVHRPPQRGAWMFLADRFRLGRALAVGLAARPPLPWPASEAASLRHYAPDRLVAVGRAAQRDRDLRRAALRSAPLVLAGATATVLGASYERLHRALTP